MAKFGRKICSKTEVVELCVFRNISVVTEKGFKLLISHSDIHLLSWCDVMSSCDHVALMALVNLQIQSRTSEACTMKQDLRAQRVNFRFNPEFSGLKMWFIHIGGGGKFVLQTSPAPPHVMFRIGREISRYSCLLGSHMVSSFRWTCS